MNSDNNPNSQKRVTNIAFISLVFVFVVASLEQGKLFGQAAQQNADAARAQAERILKQAREVTRKDLNNAEIKGLIIKSRTEISEAYPEAFLKAHPQFHNQRNEGTADGELGAGLPDKLRQKIEVNYPTNQWVSERTLNNERLARREEVLVDGRPINFAAGKPKSEQEEIAQLKDDAFLVVFPILLDYSVYRPVELKYVGAAEAGGTKADVLEAVLTGGTKYRFFFDQQTHLLLLANETWTSRETDKERARKYFFSDYRKEDGLLIAHKIITEENGEVTAERLIKHLQINPTFKPDYFAVKGN